MKACVQKSEVSYTTLGVHARTFSGQVSLVSPVNCCFQGWTGYTCMHTCACVRMCVCIFNLRHPQGPWFTPGWILRVQPPMGA